ncbi:MAG: S41 family peptidase [Anaerolineales bacterium]|nr:S41 family peptidase [Anaerolineales bacterium]MCB8961513.1 S41 family peptidase [Ardenticatenales bacterium]
MNMRSLTRIFLGLLAAVVLVTVGLAGGLILGRTMAQPSLQLESGADGQLIDEAWQTIQDNYVDQAVLTDETLTYGAIDGIVQALGDTGHSRFLTPAMVAAQHEYTSGEFEGIGAYVESQDGIVVIVSPIDNSPAQAAGLLPGDMILAVDGEDVTNMPVSEVVGRVLGPAGSEVTLTIFTPATETTRDVTVTRAKIELENVRWAQLPGTTLAHVRIAAFSDGVSEDLVAALQEIQAAGLTGVVLDLRNNPGGLLTEAVGVTSQFLPEDSVVLQRQNAQGEISLETAIGDGAALTIPVVVLINQGSASASEIVAGALQDAERAQLVGMTTFGTGTVLREFSLSDGSAMLLATELWLTPAGRVIWHKGVEPDLMVDLPAGTVLLSPEREAQLSAAELQANPDEQLLQAITLLENTQ